MLLKIEDVDVIHAGVDDFVGGDLASQLNHVLNALELWSKRLGLVVDHNRAAAIDSREKTDIQGSSLPF